MNVAGKIVVCGLLTLSAMLTACGGRGCAGKKEPAAPRAELSPVPPPPAITPAPGTAAGELTVVASAPQGDIYGEVRPNITFSRPVMTLGDIESEKQAPPPAQISPPVEGEWRWLGSATVEFVSTRPFPLSSEFTVTVPAGLKALDGAELKKEHRFSFRTPRPQIQSIEPGEGFSWLVPDQLFILVLNQPVIDLEKHARLELLAEPPRNIALKLVNEVNVAEELKQAQGRRSEMEDLSRSQNRQTRYELRPAERLPLASRFALVVPSGLRGREGSLASEAETRYEFSTYGPMNVVGARACLTGDDRPYACPWGPLVILTSNKADVKSLAEKLTIEPPVKVEKDSIESYLPERWLDIDSAYAVVRGAFRPGTRYRIMITAGLKDEYGQSAPAWEGSVRFGDLEPSFSLGEDEALLEASGDGALPVEAVNIKQVDVELWTPDAALMARLLSDRYRAQQKVGAPAERFSLDVSGAANTPRTVPLGLKKHLAPEQRGGLFFLRATSPQLPRQGAQQVFAQITDLAVHAKLGPRDGLVWVTSLSAGAPVEGAELELYDGSGRLAWSGQSGPGGLAQLPGLAALIPRSEENEWGVPFALIKASFQGDTGITLSQWHGGIDPWAFELPGEWEGNTPRSRGLLLSERGIYRPGDTVYIKGVFRLQRLGRLATPPAGTPVELVVTSSLGKKVFSQKLKLSRFGTFHTKFALQKDVPLGGFGVEASLRADGQRVNLSTFFRVEEYRPPQFKVDVTAPEHLSAGDPLRAEVLARYLFGGAMAGARVRWSVTRCSSPFTPPGNAGFEFGVNTWWWDDEQPDPGCDTFAAGEGLADRQGNMVLEPGVVETPAGKSFRYTVEAEVEDVNRQRQANRREVTVHPAAAYAGVRLKQSGFAEAGKKCRLEVIAADAQGERLEGLPVEVKLLRREWKSIRKQGVGNRWFTVTEPVEEPAADCRIKTEKNAVDCEFVPEKPGLYIAAAEVRDEKGRTQTTRSPFYVVGPGWVSWQRNDTSRIDLVADKTLYDVGESARVLIKSPYPKAEALVTVEREGVFWSKRVTLTGTAQAIEVPITEEMIPNAFIGAILVRGRVADQDGLEEGDDPGRPAVRVGYTQVKVERKSKRLQVSLQPDAAEKRPRDKVKLALQVKDHRGSPVPAELTLWAVDEGVLRLTDYQLPDPVLAVHREHGLSVRIGEPLLKLVLRRRWGDKGQEAGGGGGDEASGAGFRSRFKTTVLFLGDKVAGNDGRAEVEFELPDNLTTYRIMALAVTPDDRFGAGQSEVVVSKPLLALPALPRLARVGDVVDAGVVVHLKGIKIDSVDVAAEVEGGLRLEGAAEGKRATRKVPLVGGAQEVRFRFLAEAPGEARLRFSVEGGGERDGVEAKLPVQLPVDIETVATYGQTRDKSVEGIVPPGGVRPDQGGLELTLASTALGGFDENLRQLVDYPYGCLEQLSSRLVPLVALMDISRTFGLELGRPGEKDLEMLKRREQFFRAWLGEELLKLHDASSFDEIAARTVRAIEALQRPDGGFGYWPGAACSADFGSAYAVLALGEARRVGFAVDRQVLEGGQRFLAEKVAAGRCLPCYFGCYVPQDATRVFALYVLARQEQPRPSYYPQFFGEREKLPLFARAMLAELLGRAGLGTDAKAVLQELLNHAQQTPAEVHFEEVHPETYAALWSSDTRTTAIVLQTLLQIEPEHPFIAKMARYLASVRKADGRFRNTQEAAFALMALSDLVRIQEKETPDFVARITLGEKRLAEKAFRGRSTAVEQLKIGMAELGKAGGKLPLVFQKDGAGILYYGARLRYAPAELPLEALDRGLVVQRWYEPYEGGGQATSFAAGDLIRVRVRVASSQERHNLVLEVPLPAGLEAIDTSLATSARLPGEPQRYNYESAEDLYEDTADGEMESDYSSFAASFWSPFNHQEIRDDRVVLFADHLPPGVHAASFPARATTPGKYLSKPARAEEMYAPEVFGRSEGGLFEITAAPEVAAK